jgi:hypothetical protein
VAVMAELSKARFSHFLSNSCAFTNPLLITDWTPLVKWFDSSYRCADRLGRMAEYGRQAEIEQNSHAMSCSSHSHSGFRKDLTRDESAMAARPFHGTRRRPNETSVSTRPLLSTPLSWALAVLSLLGSDTKRVRHNSATCESALVV